MANEAPAPHACLPQARELPKIAMGFALTMTTSILWDANYFMSPLVISYGVDGGDDINKALIPYRKGRIKVLSLSNGVYSCFMGESGRF